MAAPANASLRNFEGKWVINKTLGDDFDEVLALQGIGWLTRKAVGSIKVTQVLRQGTRDNGEYFIDIDQLAAGGVKGTTEKRTLDWTYRDHSDWLFGEVKGKSRWSSFKQVLEDAKSEGKNEQDDAKWLTEGWLPETETGEIVEGYVESVNKGWTSRQVWGFIDIKGERYSARKFVVRKGEEVVRVRLVYDYAGPVDEKK